MITVLFYSLFSYYIFKTQHVLYTESTSQFGLGTFQGAGGSCVGQTGLDWSLPLQYSLLTPQQTANAGLALTPSLRGFSPKSPVTSEL